MTPELQALIERADAYGPDEAVALLRLVEAFEPPTERQKRAFLASVAALVAARSACEPH